MKLGATIQSERGKPVTKTGNEYLNIEVLNEKKYPVIQLHAKPFGENGLIHAIIRIDGQEKIIWAGYLKNNGNLKHGKYHSNKCGFCELPLTGGNINERCHCD